MLEIIPFYITAFKQKRLIRIYLPKNYNKDDQRYPVLYMHDGQNVFHDKDAIGGTSLNLENYLDENELNVIVVGIDQNSEERINEYCPWICGEYSKKFLGQESLAGGKGIQYVDFIVRELKPFIDNNYRTLTERTAMAGMSLGGLISTFAMCRYPQIFRNIAILSSAFYRNQEEIEKLIQCTDLSQVKNIYLDCGTRESGDVEVINKEFLASNKVIYEILKEKVPNVEFQIVKEAEHNYVSFRDRVPKLFTFLSQAK
ncbi:alpha/beta hydrolase [Lysinibacillus antri]|uniref:Alpha/beta hydrolase n=1 Tax=Lysinibacillus antri TaxID=2498145 RepID=A0A432LDR0_9BACI|nr:alpha/beta hydrolase [Lysinibacillus antri]